MSPAYQRLGARDDSIVLDVGCGTGDALSYLSSFSSYLGIDTDPRAIEHAKSKYARRPNVRFECRVCTPEMLSSARPTHVAMVGLLHHLSDLEALALLRALSQVESMRRAVTLDIVYLKGRFYNNLLARLDRGRHCRTVAGYVELVEQAGLAIADQACMRCHPTRGLVDYCVLELCRRDDERV
jgi:SAM-dependent methyltransferase